MLVWNDFGATDMRTSDVAILRVYLTEGERQLNELMSFLKEKEEVRGMTIFRGSCGFGPSGQLHIASLSDLSLDLPLVIEMFDEPGKIQRVMKHLCEKIKPGHMVSWSAKINVDGIDG